LAGGKILSFLGHQQVQWGGVEKLLNGFSSNFRNKKMSKLWILKRGKNKILMGAWVGLSNQKEKTARLPNDAKYSNLAYYSQAS